MPTGRYLFLTPGRRKPSGGSAVNYHAIACLRRLGYDAAALHDGRTDCDPFSPHTPPRFFSPALNRVRMRQYGIVGGLRVASSLAADRLRRGGNSRLHLTPQDTIVVSEYLLDLALEAFPDQRKIVSVQNPFSYLDALARAEARGLDAARGVVATLATSRDCAAFAETVGVGPVLYVPVAPDFSHYAFRAEKRRQIAYMPRKRRAQARILPGALRRRGPMRDFDIVAIDGVPQPEVARILGDSLIFVSLLEREGLGFPAMEAMASGCVTIGYTGLGGREFFDEASGRVVEDGDLPGLVAAIEETVAEYDRDPARLDALRRAASERVTATYTTERFETALAEAWAQLEGPPPGL